MSSCSRDRRGEGEIVSGAGNESVQRHDRELADVVGDPENFDLIFDCFPDIPFDELRYENTTQRDMGGKPSDKGGHAVNGSAIFCCHQRKHRSPHFLSGLGKSR